MDAAMSIDPPEDERPKIDQEQPPESEVATANTQPAHLEDSTDVPMEISPSSRAVASDGIERSDSVGLLLQPSPSSTEMAPSQPSSGPGFVDTQNHTPLDRPLNVTDALSYLDAVKVQFQDQPDVYNHFLDIMKEFKSQLIDTPGVIKRVSHLFNGHPSLIQGFNTFLPVGYRIECSTDAHDANFITVTTPTGTTMQTTNNGPNSGPILWSTTQTNEIPRSTNINIDHTSEVPGGTEPHHIPQPSSTPDPRMYVEGSAIGPALQYVQKIKHRCDPETYQQFLDILSKYHSQEGDSIDEREVSVRVARLFKDAPDLRSDFRIFMPQKSQQLFDDDGGHQSTHVETSRVRGGTPASASKRKLDAVGGVTLPQKRKRKVAEKEKEKDVAPAKPGSSSKVKKPRHAASHDLTPSSYNQLKNVPGPSSPRQPIPVPPQPQPPRMEQTHSSASSSDDDAHFFDRVKRSLDNRDTYNEFLKLVNLFTQDYIDTSKLVKEARNYLGDGELMRQFRNILGWDEKKQMESWSTERHTQYEWTRPLVVAGGVGLDRPTRADLNVKYGSYRKLPASEVNVTCSGRDEMCRSVLNDEWVSHPTWSSEDPGFIAHKKNIYEEALHRSEEERHEYDFHIEAIVRTITMLEPINNKIAQLSQEERGNFKLKPNLGGSGKSIHHRVIKKIYGREAGLDVIQAMQDSPAQAIPVVLHRLKMKEEEWRRAQKEWNKVWREVDARNFVKSLDHQGIAFKAADKKTITTKAFVSQIEAAREEQMAKRASLIDPLFARTRPRYQLEFVLDDMQVLQDTLKLTFSFLDRTQGQINFTERKRIEGFLRSFIPLFFMLDSVAFNSAFVVLQESQESDASDDPSGSALPAVDTDTALAIPAKPAVRSHRKGAAAAAAAAASAGAGDLRKKLLKSEQAKLTNRKTRAQDAASPSVSRLASPVLPDALDATTNDAGPDAGGGQSRRVPRKNIFYTNTAFYCLLRLVDVIFSRLALFKNIAAKLASEPRQSPDCPRQPNCLANQLGIPLRADKDLQVDRSTAAEHYYDLLLESCERLFDNELEPHVFEDQMRYMFGTKNAYKIFTIDKLIGALIKQVQTIIADSKSEDLLENLKRERALPSPTTQDQINCRHNAEKVLGPDDYLFRIDWLSDSKTMTVQLIGKDDSSYDDSEVLTGRWQSYIDSFVSLDPTPGVPVARIRRPFLRRNPSPAANGTHPDIVAHGNLEIKVCVRTYRIFYVPNTEDFLWRISSSPDIKKAASQLLARTRLRKQWIERMDKGLS